VSEIVINAAGDQPAVAPLRNTQFVVAWMDASDASIKAQTFGTNGAASGPVFRVNTPTQTKPKRQLPKIVDTAQGLAVIWIEQAAGAGPTGGANVKLCTIDADTMSPGEEIQVSTAPVEPLQPPVMARLSDGGFVVVWADLQGAQRVRAQRFAADGTRVGSEIQADTTAGLHRRPMVTGLTNGNFAVGWLARISGPLHIRFQVFDATGAPIGHERILTGGATMATMTGLSSGRLVIAGVRNAGDGEVIDRSVVQHSVFGPTGGPLATEIPITNEQAILSSWPTLAPLPGGRFVTGWTQGSISGTPAGENIKAGIFDDSLGPVGRIAQLNDPGIVGRFSRFSLCAATAFGLSDGDTLFTGWTAQASDGTNHGLRGRAQVIPAGGLA